MNSLPKPSATDNVGCCVRFGGAVSNDESGATLPSMRVPMDVLGGLGSEVLLADTSWPTRTVNGCTLFRRGRDVAGFVAADAELDLETAAFDLYRSVFAATEGLHLYRLWNYVPRINSLDRGLENYRRFCRGRSLAFEAAFGHEFQRVLPSASAVGVAGGPLAIGFVAGASAPQHYENPRQVPAFQYPAAYGPRPPSFSRATVVAGETRRIYISGTAAIRGHESVALHDIDAQLTCTLENLNVIAGTTGAGPRLGAQGPWQRTFKVYLRRAADFELVAKRLSRELFHAADAVSYLHAAICRENLLVEIEATLTQSAA